MPEQETEPLTLAQQTVYTCSGPFADDEMTQEDFKKLMESIKPPFLNTKDYENLQDSDSFFSTDPMIPTSGPFKGKRIIIRRRPGGLTAVRFYCGTNVSKAVLSLPEDGEIHKVTCPQCGTVATVRRTPPEPEG